MKPKNNQFLEKLKDGRYHIREKIIIDGSKLKKLPLTESTKVVEVDGVKLKCRGAYSGVEISKPNQMNLNERIYTEKLWANVINNQKHIWEGGIGLGNHPKEDADVLKTFCVWHNLRFNEKKDLVIADMYCVGENGQLAVEVLDAGGKIGLSSSGFGDFQDDGVTIQENYELERVADWVDAPSYQVYAKKDDEVQNEKSEKLTKEEMKQLLENSEQNQLFEKTITNKTNDNKENCMSDKNDRNIKLQEKISQLEEKRFRIDVKRLKAEADTKDSIQEKFNLYKEILSYFEDVDFATDLKEELLKNMESFKEEIINLAEEGKKIESLKEKNTVTEEEKDKISEELNTLKEKYEQLKSKYEVATEMLDEMKDYTSKLKELYRIAIAEKNGMVKPSDYVKLHKYVEKLENTLKNIKKDSVSEKIKTEENKSIKESEKVNKEKFEEKKNIKETKEDNEEKEDTTEKDIVLNEDEKIEEIFNFRNDEEVQAYYEDLLEQNPSIVKIKEEILACKTLLEAERVWLNKQDEIDDIPSPYKRKRVEDSNFNRGIQESSITNTLKIRKGWV